MRAFTLRWIDALAVLSWMVCAGLAVAVSAVNDDGLRAWVVVSASAAVISTGVAWTSRRLDRLENHVYTEGMRAGLDAKRVLHLPEQRS